MVDFADLAKLENGDKWVIHDDTVKRRSTLSRGARIWCALTSWATGVTKLTNVLAKMQEIIVSQPPISNLRESAEGASGIAQLQKTISDRTQKYKSAHPDVADPGLVAPPLVVAEVGVLSAYCDRMQKLFFPDKEPMALWTQGDITERARRYDHLYAMVSATQALSKDDIERYEREAGLGSLSLQGKINFYIRLSELHYPGASYHLSQIDSLYNKEKWLQLASEQGHAEASHDMALANVRDREVWLRKAANQGRVEARLELAQYLGSQEGRVAEAIQLYQSIITEQPSNMVAQLAFLALQNRRAHSFIQQGFERISRSINIPEGLFRESPDSRELTRQYDIYSAGGMPPAMESGDLILLAALMKKIWGEYKLYIQEYSTDIGDIKDIMEDISNIQPGLYPLVKTICLELGRLAKTQIGSTKMNSYAYAVVFAPTLFQIDDITKTKQAIEMLTAMIDHAPEIFPDEIYNY